jgi:hypothetical protein
MCSVVEGFLDRPGRGLRCAGSDIENSSSFADSVLLQYLNWSPRQIYRKLE